MIVTVIMIVVDVVLVVDNIVVVMVVVVIVAMLVSVSPNMGRTKVPGGSLREVESRNYCVGKAAALQGKPSE